MRPEAQLSDPINWDTSLYDKVFWEDIRHACAISPELWILRGKLSPNPRVMEAPENCSGSGFASFNLRPTIFSMFSK